MKLSDPPTPTPKTHTHQNLMKHSHSTSVFSCMLYRYWQYFCILRHMFYAFLHWRETWLKCWTCDTVSWITTIPASHVSSQVLHNPPRRKFGVHAMQQKRSFSLCFMHYYTFYMLKACGLTVTGPAVESKDSSVPYLCRLSAPPWI